MNRRNDEVAFDGGANHDGELVNQLFFVLYRHRQSMAQGAAQPLAIAQHEERQIQHDEQAGDEVKRIHANAQRLCGNQLSGLRQRFAESVLNTVKIVEAKAVQHRCDPGGQGIKNAPKVACGVDLARLQALVKRSRVARQCCGDQRHWNDDNDNYQHQGEQRSACAFASETGVQAVVNRCKD